MAVVFEPLSFCDDCKGYICGRLLQFCGGYYSSVVVTTVLWVVITVLWEVTTVLWVVITVLCVVITVLWEVITVLVSCG